VARKPDAVTPASKIVNSVAEWVSSRHLRRSDRNRFAYQSRDPAQAPIRRPPSPVSRKRLYLDVGMLASERPQIVRVTGRDEAAAKAYRGCDDEGVDGMA
jgi:hypothetical protein